MPVRIRLQRHGKKHNAFFHIVVADGRAPRDGKFIEKLGTYNPNTNPATINIDFESAITWLGKGAQPSDTCRAILSYRGILYKHHLQGGVAKGALTQEQADAKFAKWVSEKEGKINSKKSGLAAKASESKKSKHAAETAVRNARAEAIAAKNTPAPAAAVEEAPVEASVEAPAATEGSEA